MIHTGPLRPSHFRVSCHSRGWTPLRSSLANRRGHLSFPQLLPFKTQPSSRQQTLALHCLNGTNQGTALLFPQNLPREGTSKLHTGQCVLSPQIPRGSRGNYSCPPRYDFVSQCTSSSFCFSWRPPERTSDSPPAQTLMGRWYLSHGLQTHAQPIADTPYLHSDSQLAT